MLLALVSKPMLLAYPVDGFSYSCIPSNPDAKMDWWPQKRHVSMGSVAKTKAAWSQGMYFSLASVADFASFLSLEATEPSFPKQFCGRKEDIMATGLARLDFFCG